MADNQNSDSIGYFNLYNPEARGRTEGIDDVTLIPCNSGSKEDSHLLDRSVPCSKADTCGSIGENGLEQYLGNERQQGRWIPEPRDRTGVRKETLAVFREDTCLCSHRAYVILKRETQEMLARQQYYWASPDTKCSFRQGDCGIIRETVGTVERCEDVIGEMGMNAETFYVLEVASSGFVLETNLKAENTVHWDFHGKREQIVSDLGRAARQLIGVPSIDMYHYCYNTQMAELWIWNQRSNNPSRQ